MPETRGRDTGSFTKASGEPDALKGASPVRIHGLLKVQVLSPLPKHLNTQRSGVFFCSASYGIFVALIGFLFYQISYGLSFGAVCACFSDLCAFLLYFQIVPVHGGYLAAMDHTGKEYSRLFL